MKGESLYLDTSAVLRSLLESGTSPELEARMRSAAALVTSRLSLVESARALLRLRSMGRSEREIADATREIESLWARCELWELSLAVCEEAQHVAPGRPLRTLDALHLATYLLARRRIPDLQLLTADTRLEKAIFGAGH
ncbi:MAG: type II toxin-antitoxin system VapC family toxin [Gemmatimonadetes bacterium]|nr:type II toxin-antitoxin system VapC family toxin [Gemmatimonadota bacterium]